MPMPCNTGWQGWAVPVPRSCHYAATHLRWFLFTQRSRLVSAKDMSPAHVARALASRHARPHRGASLTRCESTSGGPEQMPQPGGSRDTPNLTAGVNWFCYSALGLLFLTDFTPLGLAIQSSDNPGVALAMLQWGAFVLPTVWFAWQQGYSFPKTFALRGCPPGLLAAAAAAGPALFSAVTALVQLRLGPLDGAAVAAGGSGLGPGWGAAGHSLASVLPLYVLSPAVAEELLFRGFLLTALRQRLGSVDSVAVSGALFALMHLSVEQFFQYSLLGFACGAACIAADSLLPAVLVHAGYNMAAVLAALAASGPN